MKTTLQKFFVSDLLGDIPLEEVLVASSDNMMITTGEGIICGIGGTMLENLAAKAEDILGYSVCDLVNRGYYNRSIVEECIKNRKKTNGLLRDRHGHYLFSTANPVFGEDGHIRFVVTNTRGGEILDQFMQERKESQKKYEGIADYLRNRTKHCSIIAESPEMRHILSMCKRIAYSDGTVLLTGESGTGKEVCATYIYENSSRFNDAFIPINCSAIPPNLVESELFGYEKGAFTGADPKGRMGSLEVANHGTVFLDEIGELPLYVQPKLLRFLETGEIKRVGGSSITHSDVRIIAATNRDLHQLVSQHKFREDLYYRLNVLPIHIPPLRNRNEDIIPLAEFFLQRFNRKYEKNVSLSPQFREKLLAYRWPGNTRELRNVIERAVITSLNSDGFALDISNETDSGNETAQPQDADIVSLHDATSNFEREYIKKAVQTCGGNITKAARLLGVHRTQIYRKLSE